MGQKIQLNESQLRKLIKESVMNEIDRRKVMPGKYYDIFKSRIINAQHGRHGDIEKAVMEFYKDFKKKVPNDGFTPENLMDLAEKIAGGEISGSHFVPGAGYGSNGFREIDAIGGDSDAFNRSYSGRFNEGRVRVTESQLRNLIKESVKKALMNEISSDMIRRAENKFYKKYGGSFLPGPDAEGFPRDKHGNLLYPKDMKPLADHYRKFEQAYKDAKEDEDLSNPLVKKAQELYNQVDLEKEVADWVDPPYGCDVNLWGEIEDENGGIWKFEGWGSGVSTGGDIGIDSVEEMNFESPDGQTGSIPRP